MFIYFCRLITLQICSGFAIHWHESAMGVHVSPILNPLPTSLPIPSSGSSQCIYLSTYLSCLFWGDKFVQMPRAFVSCIQPGLVICFTLDNRHVSMLFSQIILPSPSPIESKSLFYTSVSFSVLHIGLSLPIFLNPIYMH